MSPVFSLASLLLSAAPAAARVGGHRHNGDLAGVDLSRVGLPSWPVSYNARASTAFMPCNSSGFFNASFAAEFGVTDFDWSNAKAHWANEKPMTCEEDLVTQAEAVARVSSSAKTFVYRNLVKALPWFTAVREKLMDPAYSGFFISFSGTGSYHVPTCDTNFSPPRCNVLKYHDQDQTPQHPHGDGSCIDACDCGAGVPCGEYLWDHRNGTMLRDFLINEHLLGPTGRATPPFRGSTWMTAGRTPRSRLRRGSQRCGGEPLFSRTVPTIPSRPDPPHTPLSLPLSGRVLRPLAHRWGDGGGSLLHDGRGPSAGRHDAYGDRVENYDGGRRGRDPSSRRLGVVHVYK